MAAGAAAVAAVFSRHPQLWDASTRIAIHQDLAAGLTSPPGCDLSSPGSESEKGLGTTMAGVRESALPEFRREVRNCYFPEMIDVFLGLMKYSHWSLKYLEIYSLVLKPNKIKCYFY